MVSKKIAVAVTLGIAVVAGSLAPIANARTGLSRSEVRTAQRIMTKFGLPVKGIDGIEGKNTRRAACAFRALSEINRNQSVTDESLSTGRHSLTREDYRALQDYDRAYRSIRSIRVESKARTGTYVLVDKTCQTLTYVERNRAIRTMAASTGKITVDKETNRTHDTPNGTFRLGYTRKGWSCSSLYPDGCSEKNRGRFAYRSNKGNMYNKRHVTGAIYVHGSTSVPTHPASHGCIRVSVWDSDWLYSNVGNHGKPKIIITGAY